MTTQTSHVHASALGRSAAVLIAITLIVKILGFAEKQIVAYYFGAGAQVDAYLVALSVPIALYLLVREIIEPAFLPLYVEHLDANRQQAGGRLFVVVGMGIAVVTVPLVWWEWAQAHSLATVLAPGFSESTRELTAKLIRIMIGGGAFLAISALTYITLNGHRRFALPAAGDLVLKSTPIVCAVMFASQLGVVALAVGWLLGSAGRFLLHAFGLARQRQWLSLPNANSKQDVQTLLLLMAPLILGVAFSQVSELADNFFASQIEGGAIAAKTFARKIIDLPVVVLPYALSIVAFPYFSSLANSGEWDALYEFLGRVLRALMLIFGFLSVSTALLAGPIVTLLLERGAFDEQARMLTAWPLQLYAMGLIAFALEAILVPFYFSLRDTRTPIILGIFGVCINIALTAALIGPMGVGGVALALTVSKSLKVAALAVLLKRKRPALRFYPGAAGLLRVVCASGVAALVIELTTLLIDTPTPASPVLAQFVYLAIASVAGVISYLGVLVTFNSPERDLVSDAWTFLYKLVVRP